MSLFFLYLSLVTFLISHSWAKRSRPTKDFSFGRIFQFEGESKAFHKKMADWILKQRNLELIEKSETHYVLEEKATLFSYGYFYHIELHEKKSGELEISYRVQPKLVSIPKDQKRAGEKMSRALDLKDVS